MRRFMRPACTGRKTGRIFVNGSEQKPCPFSGSGGRYTSSRPSSPFCLPCAQLSDFVETYIKLRFVSVNPRQEKKCPRCPKSKEAVKHRWCLTALTTKNRTRAGPSRLALKAPCTLTLTAPPGFAIRTETERAMANRLSLCFKHLVQMMLARFQIINIRILPEAHIH